jgi:translation initiation factor eIF-2B subunit epsilon
VLGLALILHSLCVTVDACVLLQAGLQVLIQDKRVFACHRDRWDTIYHSELGSSLAILNAGFNIDCLMMRYQGVDWRDTASWECNARWAPTNPHT